MCYPNCALTLLLLMQFWYLTHAGCPVLNDTTVTETTVTQKTVADTTVADTTVADTTVTQKTVTDTTVTQKTVTEKPYVKLTGGNFSKYIHNKEKSFVVEYQKNWCPFCIRFEPVWNAYAADIKGWKTVVVPAAIDCALEENIETCKQYQITSVPTVRIIWPNSGKKDVGERLPLDEHSVEYLCKVTIDALESKWDKIKQNQWPDIRPSNVRSLSQAIKTFRRTSSRLRGRTGSKVYAVIEPKDSYAGRKLILDFSGDKSKKILRILTSNTHFLNDLKQKGVHVKTFPALVLVGPSNPKVLLQTNSKDARYEFRELLGGPPKPPPIVKPTQKPDNTTVDKSKVYKRDMRNAMFVSFTQEIPGHEEISGEKMTALKDFVEVLAEFYPRDDPVNNYFKALRKALEHKTKMTGTEFGKMLKSIKTSEAYLPKLKEYIGCRPSIPGKRGYTCGLWTTFHSLTIGAYIRNRKGTYQEPVKTLLAIRGYIKNYFSCIGCRNHFVKMTQNMEKEFKKPQDVILYLWKAHNKVNKRLKGDDTEDPKYPKEQFPPAWLCPQCRTGGTDENPQWDEEKVLAFFLDYYHSSSMAADTDNS